MKPIPPEGDLPHLAGRVPGLARRSRRLAAIVTTGLPLELTVRHRGRRYSAQIYDPGSGRRWRCPHGHFTWASARQCAGAMARRIHRLGWQRAIGPQRQARGARGRSG